MKLAVVCPKEYHSLLGILNMSFHLVEAIQAYEDDAYLQWYKGRRDTGQFIMMDNGAAEVSVVHHGSAMEAEGVVRYEDVLPFTTVLAIAEQLRADEIILPDMKMDAKWTLKHSKEWAKDVAPRKRAVVPQGTNWEEWEENLARLVVDCTPATICVTKDYEELPGGRAHAIQIIKEMGYFGNRHVHLLGLKALPPRGIRTEIQDILEMHPSVRSLDTGAPIAYAQHDVSIRDHRIRFSLDWNAEAGKGLVLTNIMMLRDWCEGVNNAHQD